LDLHRVIILSDKYHWSLRTAYAKSRDGVLVSGLGYTRLSSRV